MTPRLWTIAGTLALLITLGAGTVFTVNSCRRKQASEAETQAHIASGEAHAHQTQAANADTLVADLKAKLENQAKQLDLVLAQRRELLRKLGASKPSSDDPSLAGLPPLPIDDSRDALIAKDAEVISAQAVVIDSQAVVIAGLTTSRDEWKATAEARERQARAQEVATDAWKKSVTTAEWKGGIKGFIAGAALGYFGGKR